MQQMLSTKQLMAAAGLGADRLAQLEADGLIKRAGRNRWSAIDTLGALIRYYRDETRRGHRSAADAALRDARAAEVRQRISICERKLIPMADAEMTCAEIVGVWTAELLGLPARISRDLGIRKKLDDEIFALRQRVKFRFGKIGHALMMGKSLSEALAATAPVEENTDGA